MLHSHDDPASMSPDERRHEIAAILARGILRLHRTRQVAAESAASDPPDHAPEGGQKDLEVSGTSPYSAKTQSRGRRAG